MVKRSRKIKSVEVEEDLALETEVISLTNKYAFNEAKDKLSSNIRHENKAREFYDKAIKNIEVDNKKALKFLKAAYLESSKIHRLLIYII